MSGRHRKPTTSSVSVAKIAFTGAVLGGGSIALAGQAAAASNSRGREEGISSCQEHGLPLVRTNIAAAHSTLRAVDTEERIAWVSKALCRQTDPDELFVRGAAQHKAAVICRHCPVMQECGADALDNKVEFGVWGGMTERQRRALLKQHPEVVSWADFFDKRKHRSVG